MRVSILVDLQDGCVPLDDLADTNLGGEWLATSDGRVKGAAVCQASGVVHSDGVALLGESDSVAFLCVLNFDSHDSG